MHVLQYRLLPLFTFLGVFAFETVHQMKEASHKPIEKRRGEMR